MSFTTITARIKDQALDLVNIPLVASGSKGVLQIKCEFDASWTGYAKVGVFYRKGGPVFHIPLQENIVTVPHEVLADSGYFSFGLLGVAGNTRTTEVLRVNVVQGSITTATAEPKPPTPDFYELLLQAYGNAENKLAVERARIDQLVAMRGGYGVEEYQIEGERFSGKLRTNGAAAFISIAFSTPPLAGNSEITDMCLPAKYAPLALVTFDSLPNSPAASASIHPRTEPGEERAGITITNNSTEDITDWVEFEGYYELESMSIPELNDARVGVDGHAYPNAGAAIRGQITQLKDATAVRRSASGIGTLQLTETAAYPLQSLLLVNPGLMPGEQITVGVRSKNVLNLVKVHPSFRIDGSTDVHIHTAAIDGATNNYQRDIFLGTAGAAAVVPAESMSKLLWLPAGIYTLSYTVVEGSTKLRVWAVASDGSVTQLDDTFSLNTPTRVTIRRSGNTALYVTGLQLEIGSTATSYEEPEGVETTVIMPEDSDIIDVLAQPGAAGWATYLHGTQVYNDGGAEMHVDYIASAETMVTAFERHLANTDKGLSAERTMSTVEMQHHFARSSNLANTVDVDVGYNIGETGEDVENAAYRRSTYIPVKPGCTYVLSGIPYVALYTANLTFIKRLSTSNGVAWQTTEETYWVRLCSPYALANWQLNEGDTLLAYEAYTRTLQNVDIKEALAKALRDHSVQMLVKEGVTFAPIPAGWQYLPDPDAGYKTFDYDLATIQAGTTKVADFYNALQALIDRSEGYLTKTVLGKDESGMYDIWEVDTHVDEYISTSMNQNNEYSNTTGRDHIPTLLLIVGAHGFEKASIYSAYFLLRDIIDRWQEDPVLDYLRWHVNFKIIPVANPWGFDNNSYFNSKGVNFNRAFATGHKVVNPTLDDGKANKEYGGPGPGEDCSEARLATAFIDANPGAVMLVDFHTTGKERKHNMVTYHNLIDGYIIDRIKLASREHINYVNQRYAEAYNCLPPADYDAATEGPYRPLRGYPYIQVTPPRGQCYTYSQTKGIYGQILEVGCNLPQEPVMYSAKCLEANTRTLGQWLYILLRTIADIYKWDKEVSA